jgi:hypothetical protein
VLSKKMGWQSILTIIYIQLHCQMSRRIIGEVFYKLLQWSSHGHIMVCQGATLRNLPLLTVETSWRLWNILLNLPLLW